MSDSEHAALSEPRIVCAAMRNQDGLVVCGPRHFDATMRAVINALEADEDFAWEQGFVDQHGRFYRREQAWVIASTNNQIVKRVGGDDRRLYSENLY